MTKREAEADFRLMVLPTIRTLYEQDGVPDLPARREAWNGYTDNLQKANLITRRQYNTWTHPKECK